MVMVAYRKYPNSTPDFEQADSPEELLEFMVKIRASGWELVDIYTRKIR